MILTGETVPRNVLLFPVSKALNGWRGNQNYFPDDIGATATSTVEWHIDNSINLPFEVRRRAGQDSNHSRVRLCNEPPAQGNAVDVCSNVVAGQAYSTRAISVWNNFRVSIQDFCQILQMPLEIMITTICNEASPSLNERSIAFEPIVVGDAFYNNLVNRNIIPNIISNQLIASYNAMGNNERYGRVVPNPFNPSVVVSNPRADMIDVSWGDIRNLIAAYFPHRISPGIAQTLIETGLFELRWLQTYYNNLEQRFTVAAINTDSNEVNNIAMFDWLLTARHSILASCARHKRSYQKFNTYFDIVRSGTVYNANGTADHPRSANSIFGYVFFGNNPPYPVKASRYYNAIKLLFRNVNNANNGSPQFWQALPE